jgi:hypothetical protein
MDKLVERYLFRELGNETETPESARPLENCQTERLRIAVAPIEGGGHRTTESANELRQPPFAH